MPGTSPVYRALARLANLALPLATPWSPKLATGDRERRAALARWCQWAAEHRDPSRPLVWLHAPSVGEGLQAEAVLGLLRRRHPDWQLILTFFSPSAAPLAGRQPVDRADYLPYDTAPNVDHLLAALRPTALVFTKLDLWPELATQAANRGAAVVMVAGTVSPTSGRRRPAARWLTRPGYRALTAAGAISAADADGLALLGTAPDRIVVTGDPRFDSALERVRNDRTAPDPALAGRPTLVAGSSWGPDEQVLAAAMAIIRHRHPDAGLVVAPHEPTEPHLRALEHRLERAGLGSVRWSRRRTDDPPGAVAIVDRVGLLAGLYRGAALAFVGGGFGSAGLHSVLEPAACGIPVLFGPRWHSSREAGLLLEAGAGRALPASPDRAVQSLAESWNEWLSDPRGRAAAGARGLAVVEGEMGAAERNAALVEEVVRGRSG